MVVKMIVTSKPTRDCCKGDYVLLPDAVAVEDKGKTWRLLLSRKREMVFAKINWTMEKLKE